MGSSTGVRSGSSVRDLGSIQVDLLRPMFVTKVATQVEEVNGYHSIKFLVHYKMQLNDNWERIIGEYGKDYVSEQNSTDASMLF